MVVTIAMASYLDSRKPGEGPDLNESEMEGGFPPSRGEMMKWTRHYDPAGIFRDINSRFKLRGGGAVKQP